MADGRRRGRPARGVATDAARVDRDALDLARRAAGRRGERLVRYLSDAIRRAAREDLGEGGPSRA